MPPRLTLPLLLLSSTLLRLTFLLYGLYQDAHSAVKYTDIDYLVFTDASRSLSQSLSPYTRETYRYTPLLAYLLLPTSIPIPGFFSFGKLLFAASDILAGYIIYRVLLRRGSDEKEALWYSGACWLLNPMVATISTRGSSEGLLGVMVVAMLWAAVEQKVVLSGILLGLATHFKIYPVIYAPAMLLAMELDNTSSILGFMSGFITLRRIKFGLAALGTFLALNLAMWGMYGEEFLQHTFFHHVVRLDHRHNFSPYNVLLYLVSSPSGASSFPFASWAFLPQMLVSAVMLPVVCAKRDLPGCLFVQTFAFVAFNKVCTSQYFMWYIVLLPFVLPGSSWLGKKGIVGLGLWVLGQAAWLGMGFKLEFLGESVFFPGLWAAALGFFGVNCWLLGEFVEDIMRGRTVGKAAIKA